MTSSNRMPDDEFVAITEYLPGIGDQLKLIAEANRARSEERRLLSLIERDKTGLSDALGHIVKEASGSMWISEGRGSYEYDDDAYRKETGEALSRIMEIANGALRASGSLVSEAFGAETKEHMEAADGTKA